MASKRLALRSPKGDQRKRIEVNGLNGIQAKGLRDSKRESKRIAESRSRRSQCPVEAQRKASRSPYGNRITVFNLL